MKTADANSRGRPPEIYCLLKDAALLERTVFELDADGWSVRGFSGADLLAHEFAVAIPRPALLIAGTVDLDDSGRAAVRKCRAIREELRVIVFAAERIADGHEALLIRQLDFDAAVLVQTSGDFPYFHGLLAATDRLLQEAGVMPVEVDPINAQARLRRQWDPWLIDEMAQRLPPWGGYKQFWPTGEERDAWIREWGGWLLSLSRAARRAYEEKNPEPEEWKGAYEEVRRSYRTGADLALHGVQAPTSSPQTNTRDDVAP